MNLLRNDGIGVGGKRGERRTLLRGHVVATAKLHARAGRNVFEPTALRGSVVVGSVANDGTGSARAACQRHGGNLRRGSALDSGTGGGDSGGAGLALLGLLGGLALDLRRKFGHALFVLLGLFLGHSLGGALGVLVNQRLQFLQQFIHGSSLSFLRLQLPLRRTLSRASCAAAQTPCASAQSLR